jgi:superfamily I DNA and/or RNA helicase
LDRLTISKSLFSIISNEGLVDIGNVFRFEKYLQTNFPDIESKGLTKFPELISQRSLKNENIPNLSIINAGCIYITGKAKNTQSIIQELESLESNHIYSKPLLSYLMKNFDIPLNTEMSDNFQHNVPAILSKPQENILQIASNADYSVIVGPPGTGKSFTIASLAINEAKKGNSILIVSSNEQAVSVIENKFKNDFNLEHFATRISSKRSLKSGLNKNLKRWLSGIGLKGKLILELVEKEKEVQKISKEIKNALSEITKLEGKELNLGEYLSQEKLGFIDGIKKYFTKRSIENIKEYYFILDEYIILNKKLIQANKRLIEINQKYRIKKSIFSNRSTLSNFRLGLNSKSSGEQLNYLKGVDINVLTSVFPVWLSTINEVGTALPMQREMFDLVIFDEASQTDITSILPVLQRAKKVVVCGDPEQLSGVSFLSKEKQLSIANSYNSPELNKQFSYRNSSFLNIILDSLKSQSQVNFLNEHYRSLPDIISYSNSEFYGNALRIMTDTPSNKSKKGLEVQLTDGLRTSKGINIKESEKIIKQIKAIIDYESKNTVVKITSIGILSPFRSQVDFLVKEIKDNITFEDIKKHNLLLGTAHSFQGDERDVMFISAVVDDNSHHGAFMHLNKSDVFNVSITRARNKMYFIHSIQDISKLKKDQHLFKFLNHKPAFETNDNSYFDDYIDKIKDWLISHNELKTDEIIINSNIAGVGIDLLIRVGEKYYGLDLVGFPGAFAKQVSIDKIRVITQLEIPIFPFAISDWTYNRDDLAKVLKVYLQ